MASKTISTAITHGVTLTAASYNFNPLYVTAFRRHIGAIFRRRGSCRVDTGAFRSAVAIES